MRIKSKLSLKSLLAVAAIVFPILLAPCTACADDVNAVNSSDWNTPSTWDVNSVPLGTQSVGAGLTGTPPYNVTIYSANASCASLDIANGSNLDLGSSYSLTTGSISIDNGNSSLTTNDSSGTIVPASASQPLYISLGGFANVNVPIVDNPSGPSSVTIYTNGNEVSFGNTNGVASAYSGGTTINFTNYMQLDTQNVGCFGTGPVTLNGNSSPYNLRLAYLQGQTNQLNINGGADLIGGSWNGPIILAANSLLWADGGVNLNGQISGSGGLAVQGGGASITSATNTYTGQTFVQNGGVLDVQAPLTNSGVAGPLGAPTGANAVIDLSNGGTLQLDFAQGGPFTTNRPINISAGNGVLNVNDNDTDFVFNGPITSSANGAAKTFVLNMGAMGNGDREEVDLNGVISDASDGSQLGLTVNFQTQSQSYNYANLTNTNTFTGPITLVQGANSPTGILTVGGLGYTPGGNAYACTPGTGSLNNGNYPGAISLGTSTVFNYCSSATQTLSGPISGPGTLMQSGPGVLTLTNSNNTYTGPTQVLSGGTLQIGAGGTIDNSNITVDSGGALAAVAGSTFTLSGSGQTLTVAGKVQGNVTVANGAVLNVQNGGSMAGNAPSETVTVNGMITPGTFGTQTATDGVGTIAIGDANYNVTLHLGSTGVYNWGISADGSTIGLINVIGAVTVDPGAVVQVNNFGGANIAGQQYTIMTWTSNTPPANVLRVTTAPPAPGTIVNWTGRGAPSLSWDTGNNWDLNGYSGGVVSIVGQSFVLSGLTATKIAPLSTSDVVIAPTGGVAAIGPANPATVASLSLGNGSDPTSLALQSAGTLTVTNGVTLNNNSTLSGTGMLATANLSVPSGTANLGGAITVAAGAVSVNGTANLNAASTLIASAVSGSGTVNFNGGAVKAAADFNFSGLGSAVVQSGGAVLNSNGHTLTLAQTLTSGGGVDGGLTVQGAGAVVVSASQAYTGATNVINGGTLKLQGVPFSPPVPGYSYWFNAANLGLANGASVTSWANGGSAGGSATAIMGNGFTPPTYIANALNGLGAVNLNGAGPALAARGQQHRDCLLRLCGHEFPDDRLV